MTLDKSKVSKNAFNFKSKVMWQVTDLERMRVGLWDKLLGREVFQVMEGDTEGNGKFSESNYLVHHTESNTLALSQGLSHFIALQPPSANKNDYTIPGLGTKPEPAQAPPPWVGWGTKPKLQGFSPRSGACKLSLATRAKALRLRP